MKSLRSCAIVGGLLKNRHHQRTNHREPMTTASDHITDILERAKSHFCFDGEAFENRDTDSLVKQGGDICDWTMIAILADDALNLLKEEKSKP